MGIFGIVSIVVIVLLVIGFLIGFWRGWDRALARLIIVGVTILLSVFLAPVISNALISTFTDGTTLNLFGNTFDFNEILSQAIGSSAAADLTEAGGATTKVVVSIMHAVINLVVFLAMFIVISLLAMLVYLIVSAVLRSKAKKANKPKMTGAKKWVLKSVGGVIGIISMVFICFALLNPLFGVMNVCNEFVKEETSNTASAAALSPSTVGGKVYYTSNETIGQVETYLEKYSNLKADYDKSPAGVVFNIFGISWLGGKTFNYLTNVEYEGVKLNLTNELVVVAQTYNRYKDAFVENEFDIASYDNFQKLIDLYDNATHSEIIKTLMVELLPKMCDRWSSGGTFLGMEFPIEGDFAPVIKSALTVYKDNNFDRLNTNIKLLFNAVQIANQVNFISELNGGEDIFELLAKDNNLVHDEIKNLATSDKFCDTLPEMFKNLIQTIYKMILEEDGDFSQIQTTSETIDWENEATQLQTITSQLSKIMNLLQNDGENISLIGNLSSFGVIIDSARDSALLDAPLKVFVLGMTNSEKLKLDSNVKDTIIAALDGNWDADVKAYSFGSLFESIDQAATFAESMKDGNVDLRDLEGALSGIIESEAAKETIKDAIENGIIEQMFGEGDEKNQDDVNMFKDMLDSFMDHTSKESLPNDLDAAQSIVDMVSDSKESGSFTLDGENDEDKQKTADELVEKWTKSDAVMGMLDKANSSGQSEEDKNSIKEAVDSLKNDESNDFKFVEEAVKKLPEDNAHKKLLEQLLGISNPAA